MSYRNGIRSGAEPGQRKSEAVSHPAIEEIGPLYVVMHDGCKGPMASGDSGNPFHLLRKAKEARARLGELRQQDYYIVKFQPEKISVRKARPKKVKL